MKLINYRYKQEKRIGVLRDGKVLLPSLDANQPIPYSDMLSLIGDGHQGLVKLAEWADNAPSEASVEIDERNLLAPILQPPRNIICLGWNYSEHINETQGNAIAQKDLPKYPIVFTKDISTINNPYDDIPYDAEVSEKIDWEAELAVVIGRTAHKINKEQALDYVFGYTVVNDITARDLQRRHGQFFLGKSLPGSCPMGPCIVTTSEISDVQALAVRSYVNGVLKQNDTTANQIFDVATVISVISNIIVLEPGSVIATGTPSGVGYVRKPPEYLRPGDIVACEVEGIGKIENRITSNFRL
ncbi:MAG: fumarylacetoacetate hydrolase family protein [Chromatiales bacterium]|nr:fumarylacetoacetate hydrolase family protein [Chromatiales bacterium]